MTETFIEVIDLGSGKRVVTVVEVLSLANKLPGDSQQKYRQKQEELRAGGVSLVEIDLLRAGRRRLGVPYHRVPISHRTAYQVCVRRGWDPAGRRDLSGSAPPTVTEHQGAAAADRHRRSAGPAAADRARLSQRRLRRRHRLPLRPRPTTRGGGRAMGRHPTPRPGPSVIALPRCRCSSGPEIPAVPLRPTSNGPTAAWAKKGGQASFPRGLFIRPASRFKRWITIPPGATRAARDLLGN